MRVSSCIRHGLLSLAVLLLSTACASPHKCEPTALAVKWAKERSKKHDGASGTQKLEELNVRYATQMLDVASACQDAKRVVFALNEVLRWSPVGASPFSRALAILEQNHRAYVGPEIIDIIDRYQRTTPKEVAATWRSYERVVRTLAEENPDKVIRGYATLMLALQSMKTVGREDAEKALLEKVIAEYADVANPKDPAAGSLGKRAQAALRELNTLSVGKMAPQIVGEDITGQAMKLSDYRNKVVMLTFWSSTCAKCMALVPHEREIAQKLSERPFVLLGVSIDDDPQLARETAKSKGMTWRNWLSGSNGEIKNAWSVYAVPTVYLIDGNGVIRYKGIGYANIKDQIDIAIDTVL